MHRPCGVAVAAEKRRAPRRARAGQGAEAGADLKPIAVRWQPTKDTPRERRNGGKSRSPPEMGASKTPAPPVKEGRGWFMRLG